MLTVLIVLSGLSIAGTALILAFDRFFVEVASSLDDCQ